MLDLKQYMEKVGVTRKEYVRQWLEAGLIPGAVPGSTLEGTRFPDSARRPYRCGSLRPGLDADTLRAHIVKACMKRQHISHVQCCMDQTEFDDMIADLVKAGLIRVRTADGIEYYDSTGQVSEDSGALKDLRAFVMDALEALSRGTAKGVASAWLDKVS